MKEYNINLTNQFLEELNEIFSEKQDYFNLI